MSDGACSIESYQLYLDDGNLGSFVLIDDAAIEDKPYLREHIVTFDASQSGLTFRFKIKSLNEIGEAESVIYSQILASIPEAPTTAPISDPLVTSISKIKVTWDAVIDDGSSEILSYSLEIDDGTGGDFTTVVGYLSDYLLFSYTITGDNIQKANLYRLRYRARNDIGWSDYSPIAYIKAANVPKAPL